VNLINDNSGSGPKRQVISADHMSKSINDLEPFQQKIILTCGHWAYNTFGRRFKEIRQGDFIRCLRCNKDS